MAKIDDLRAATYNETVDILDKYGRCVIVRPTGFGKTGILTKLLKRYKSPVYVYPAEIIREAVLLFHYKDANAIPEDRTIPNVLFITYDMFTLCAEESNEVYTKLFRDIVFCHDILIFDECHKLGADKTAKALDKALSLNFSLRILGATATPERMDMVDEIARFFQDRTISEYNLHHAFQDRILQRPYYYYCNYKKMDKDRNKDVRLALDELLDSGDYGQKEARLLEISNIHLMPETIKQICLKHAAGNYYRFLCFFSCFQTLHENSSKIVGWFQEAFSGQYSVRITMVTSETDESIENAKKIKHLGTPEYVIDLILTCNMLNLGYHVDNLTGICMFRSTQSGIVFAQQLGRILSSGSTKPGICIDIVDNIHMQSAYKLLGKRTSDYTWRKKRLALLKKKKAVFDLYCAYQKGEELDEDTVFEEYPNITSKDIQNIKSNACSFTWLNSDEEELRHLSARIKEHRSSPSNNVLLPEDLIVMSVEASYRDLIRKTVAEAKAMRARQAWARWIEQGGIDKAEDGRPLSRKEVLAQMPPEQVPLPPFCYAKRVSVEAVLDEMGVAE